MTLKFDGHVMDHAGFKSIQAELWVRHYSKHDGIIRKFMEVVED